MTGNGERITQAELSRRHDVAKSTVTSWKKQGLLVMESGKVVVEPTERNLERADVGKYRGEPDLPAVGAGSGTNGRSSVPVDEVDPAAWTQAEARRQKEIELARKHALERRKREGELVEVSEVERRFEEEWRRFREAFLSWPGRVAAEIAADLEADPGLVGSVLEVYVRRFLREQSE